MKKQTYWNLIALDIISKLVANDINIKVTQIADTEELNEAQTQMLRNRIRAQRKYFDFELTVNFRNADDADKLEDTLKNAGKKENETWGAFLRAIAIQKQIAEAKAIMHLDANF